MAIDLGSFNPISSIGNLVSSGINAVEDLGKGDISGALSNGVSALAGGFMAANPEIGMGMSLLGPLSGMLSSLTGGAGSGGLSGAGQAPGPFSNITGMLGNLLQNPLSALTGLFGGGNGAAGGTGGTGATGGTSSGGSSGLPDVNSTMGNIMNQIQGQLGLQSQMAQFQIQVQELTSLINDLKTMGTDIARNI